MGKIGQENSLETRDVTRPYRNGKTSPKEPRKLERKFMWVKCLRYALKREANYLKGINSVNSRVGP
jgi:hypothetical protein